MNPEKYGTIKDKFNLLGSIYQRKRTWFLTS